MLSFQAPDVSIANSKLFKKLIRVLCNAEGFRPTRDVPLRKTYIPFKGLGPVNLGQASRPILAFFEGRARGYIGEVVFKHLKDQLDKEVQVHERLPEGQNYTKIMGQRMCLSG
jgi:xylogalacturonan beta-1,3-xylosyltransferase